MPRSADLVTGGVVGAVTTTGAAVGAGVGATAALGPVVVTVAGAGAPPDAPAPAACWSSLPRPPATPATTTVASIAAAATAGRIRVVGVVDRGVVRLTGVSRRRATLPAASPPIGDHAGGPAARRQRSIAIGCSRLSSPRSERISPRILTMIIGELSVDSPRVRGK